MIVFDESNKFQKMNIVSIFIEAKLWRSKTKESYNIIQILMFDEQNLQSCEVRVIGPWWGGGARLARTLRWGRGLVTPTTLPIEPLTLAFRALPRMPFLVLILPSLSGKAKFASSDSSFISILRRLCISSLSAFQACEYQQTYTMKKWKEEWYNLDCKPVLPNGEQEEMNWKIIG